jgi:hypothetical protein
VLSLIPSVSGELIRELGQAKYLATQVGSPSKVGALMDYPFNQTDGSRSSVRFCATSTQLFKEVAGAWVVQSLMNPTTGLVTTTPFTDYPQFVVINNLLHVADGAKSWLYDGPNNAFVVEGFILPVNKPGIDTATAGTLTTTVGRYYWYTFADETAGRVHTMGEVLSGRQAELARAVSERLDSVTHHLSQSMTTTRQHTVDSLTKLNERLAVIDGAQKNITDLASQVTSLQSVLSNKQARGAFGQGRMEAIVETLEILSDAKAMKVIADHGAGRTRFRPLAALDRDELPSSSPTRSPLRP